MRIFLAGIMQGSHRDAVLHDQNYRRHIRQLLELHVPEADVYDPLADHRESLSYDEETGRRVFFRHNEMCREVDVVLAFVPTASMGTAIEMWEAHRAGRLVVAISPLAHNWAVKFLSDWRYADLETFESAVISGEFARRLVERVTR